MKAPKIWSLTGVLAEKNPDKYHWVALLGVGNRCDAVVVCTSPS